MGAAETLPLDPPYDLVTAGTSLHWMDWPRLLPRLQTLLTPSGRLVIVEEDRLPLPWEDELHRLIRQYSTNRDYTRVDLVTELVRRGLFRLEGRQRTAPETFVQPLDAYGCDGFL